MRRLEAAAEGAAAAELGGVVAQGGGVGEDDGGGDRGEVVGEEALGRRARGAVDGVVDGGREAGLTVQVAEEGVDGVGDGQTAPVDSLKPAGGAPWELH